MMRAVKMLVVVAVLLLFAALSALSAEMGKVSHTQQLPAKKSRRCSTGRSQAW
jgi:hypothetical protein